MFIHPEVPGRGWKVWFKVSTYRSDGKTIREIASGIVLKRLETLFFICMEEENSVVVERIWEHILKEEPASIEEMLTHPNRLVREIVTNVSR